MGEEFTLQEYAAQDTAGICETVDVNVCKFYLSLKFWILLWEKIDIIFNSVWRVIY